MDKPLNIVDIQDSLPVNPNPKRVPTKRKLTDITGIAVHCSDWDAPALTIAKYDVTPNKKNHISALGCPTFTYHYYIEKDGLIQRCVGANKVTWHVGDHNDYMLGICMRYVSTDNPNPPTQEQISSLLNLLHNICLWLGIDPDQILGHRELLGTGYSIINGKKVLRKECPGLLVNMKAIRYTVSKMVQETLKTLGYYTGEVDGYFGPNSMNALEQYIKNRKVG